MAQKKQQTRTRKKKYEEEEESFEFSTEFLSHVSPQTWRVIGGIGLLVLAVLFLLSALSKAGVAGSYLYKGMYYVFGIGYYVLIPLFVLFAVSLFSNSQRENSLRTMRSIGGGLFFCALLGIVGVLNATYAGVLGYWISAPLVQYLDTVATLVILAGILIASLLLVVESDAWVRAFAYLKGLFARKEGVEEFADASDEDASLYSVSANPTLAELSLPIEKQSEQEGGEEGDEEIEDEEPFLPETKEAKPAPKAPAYEPSQEYVTPPVSLLELDRGKPNVGDTKARANIIRRTLQHFKIPVEMDEIIVGPTVTRYSLKPAEGVRLSKILALQSNLELALAASPIRIEAPIPGKSLVGIEVPNTGKSIVGLGGLLASPEFTDEAVPLFAALGKDIAGAAHYANVGKMPHLLVAGTTGSGKSVMMHSLITSLLYRNSPERLRFIMVDPKRVELTLFNNIPHLLTPVITDAKKCILSLKWAAKEMDRRYDILQQNKVQDLSAYHNEVVSPALAHYNRQKEKGKDMSEFELPDLLPHIVIVIDELADIMSAYPRELESAIVRLAQMSRAVGIHLILSTQRPSVNVITGLIKANIPSRIAFKVASLIDSRTILDQPGAEKLLGAGDMLYLSGDMAKPRRIQSPFLSTAEVKNVVAFLIKNNNYMLPTPMDLGASDNGVAIEEGAQGGGNAGASDISFDDLEKSEDLDPMYDEVRAFVAQERKVSTSLLQRRFKMGYGRAARLLDQLEENGVIAGSSEGGNKGREVLIYEGSGGE